MGIQRKTAQAVGITNASGQPEIVLEIEGLTLSMTPPAPPAETTPAETTPASDTDTP